MKIPFFKQEISEDMKNAALNALQNESFVMGESVQKFEEEFASFIGTRYAVSTSSGTSALFLSLQSLGIKKGDNVITSTNSFVASANSIRMTNANPILADINEDGNMNVERVNKKIQAILPVHIYGNPCNFDSIIELSEEQNIPIIEDACQAHGAEFKNKKIGNLGTIGCFSFYPTKNMTVGGDGGMITTNDEEIAKIISSLRDNGRSLDKREVHEKLGYTMRLNSINAAIGRIQLRKLNQFNERRRKIRNIYKKIIEEDILLKENENGKSVFHQIVIRHKNRDMIMEELKKEQIGSGIHYSIPIHQQPIYQNGISLPNSEKFCKEILSLPSYPSLSDEEVKIIAEKINSILNKK